MNWKRLFIIIWLITWGSIFVASPDEIGYVLSGGIYTLNTFAIMVLTLLLLFFIGSSVDSDSSRGRVAFGILGVIALLIIILLFVTNNCFPSTCVHTM